jgi:TP901-1 family phage major tail protein
MSAFAGRDAILTVATGVPNGVKTKSLTINNEPIDITSDDDNGFRTMLTDAGTMSVDMSVEGVVKDDQLVALATGDGDLIKACSIDFPGVGTISGDFFIASLELGAPHNDQATFTASLQSSGAFAFAAATT